MYKCKTIGCGAEYQSEQDADFCPLCQEEKEPQPPQFFEENFRQNPADKAGKLAEGVKHGHYFKDVSHLKVIDVYRIIELFQVPAGPLDHALKKILCAGNRGAKDMEKDIQEVIDSCKRWQEMRREDAALR